MKKSSIVKIYLGSFVVIGLLLVSLLVASEAQAVEIKVFDQDRAEWEKAVGIYEEEFFTDAILNPGVSVVSEYPGHIDTTKGVWWDRLVCPYWGKTTTIWRFDIPIIGFGGNWNPGVPGGPGANIEVAINGSWINVGEISRFYTGQFWGFVSSEPFSKVRLEPGLYCYPPGGAWCETYELDNMVYSYAGRILPDEAVKLAKEVTGAPYLWGGKGYDLIEGKFVSTYQIATTSYNYYNPTTGTLGFGKGLDCSGLSMWTYDRAYYGDEKVNWGKCIDYPNFKNPECPLGYEGVDK